MINIFTSAKIPHVGGMSTHILAIKDYLENSGRECHLYAKPGDPTPRSGGASRFPPAVYALSMFAKIVYCFASFPAATGPRNYFHDWFSILGVRHAKGARRILYVHGELANELVALGTIKKHSIWYRFFQRIERMAVARADTVVCVDTRLANYVREQLGFEAISKSNFVSTPKPIREPMAPEDDIRIVLSRRFVEKNGLEYALAAVDLLVSRVQGRFKVQCDVFGTGQLFADLSQRFQRDYVHFHGDVDPDTVRRYLRNAHFSLVPSVPVGDYVEATSISALEAAAEGTIVVASDVGGLRDLFAGTGGACLVPPRDAEAIAKAMLDLTSDKSAFVHMATTGQNVVLNEHSDRIYVEQFLLTL